jgi:hypothetical protein
MKICWVEKENHPVDGIAHMKNKPKLTVGFDTENPVYSVTEVEIEKGDWIIQTKRKRCETVNSIKYFWFRHILGYPELDFINLEFYKDTK